VTRSKVNTD